MRRAIRIAATGAATLPFPSSSSLITLGYTEGQDHLSGAIDEVLVTSNVASAGTIAGLGVRGIILNPNNPDTDGDGLADGQELYTYTVKTPLRYPIPDSSSTMTDPLTISLGAPAWAIGNALAMAGITHADMGEVSDNLYFRSGVKAVQSFNLKLAGSNAGQANNFTSYDLFQLGLSRSTLAASLGNAYLIAWDNWGDGKKGQVEYVQLQFTVHLLPNRADTDGDGLNDSEEVNLGHDGFVTNPWKADTDSDGIPDGLESGGWSWSYSTIVADPNGFTTDPTRADTDRDGVPDNRDRAPLGDLFVEVSINSISVTGSDSHNGGTPHPFVEASILGNSTYTLALGSASGAWLTSDPFTLYTYPGHRLSVNVPDDATTVVVSLAAWSYDTRGYNNQVPIIVGSHTEYLGGVPYCVSDPTVSLTYAIQLPGQSTSYSLRGCSGTTPMYANPLSVTLTTLVPTRVNTNLIVPADYSGLYNVTDAQGTILSRRYTGEPRFVALLLNETTYDNAFHCYCGPAQADIFIVPRSVFFDTRLYAYLNASNPISPLDKLTFRQNSTSATMNADDIQEILTGNVTSLDVAEILLLLIVNATGVAVRRAIALGNDLLLYSLPDGAVHLVGYRPPLTGISMAYTFCTSSCDPPPPKPWWERVWDGLVSVVTAFVTSAIVLAINSFRMVVAVLSQLGNWLAQQVANAVAAVKSAVAVAAKVVGQLMDFVTLLIKAMVQNSLGPLLAALSGSAAQTRLSIQATYPSAVNQYQHTGSVDSATLQLLVNTLLGSYVWALLGLSAIVVAIGIALYPIAPIGLAIMTIAGAIAGALLFKAMPGWTLHCRRSLLPLAS